MESRHKLLCHVNDYIEPVVIYIAWMQFYSAKFSIYIARVAGLCEVFVQRNFSGVRQLAACL